MPNPARPIAPPPPPAQMLRPMGLPADCLLLFLLLYPLPVAAAALLWRLRGGSGDWRGADRSSTGLLPPPARGQAVLRVFAARTVRWRGIVACHCWVVFKPPNAAAYTRYDYTAWGEPIRLNGFEADGRWFGRLPSLVLAVDGAAAARLIPPLQAAIAGYAHARHGDYRAWPGPNSNTFVAALLHALPGVHATLPPIAIGKDYPHDGRWLRPTASRTGLTLTLGGYAALTLGWGGGAGAQPARAGGGGGLAPPRAQAAGVRAGGDGLRGARQDKEASAFFFEKKNQKTFAGLVWLACSPCCPGPDLLACCARGRKQRLLIQPTGAGHLARRIGPGPGGPRSSLTRLPPLRHCAPAMDPAPDLPLDQVLRGECVTMMRMLPSASIDCVFADPPLQPAAARRAAPARR